jgi:hypothetical protein
VAVLRGERGVPLGHDHRQAVRDDVVQVPADPGPLGGRRERDPLPLLAFQVGGALFEGPHVGVAAAGRLAQRVGEGQRQQDGQRQLDDLLLDERPHRVVDGESHPAIPRRPQPGVAGAGVGDQQVTETHGHLGARHNGECRQRRPA